MANLPELYYTLYGINPNVTSARMLMGNDPLTNQPAAAGGNAATSRYFGSGSSTTKPVDDAAGTRQMIMDSLQSLNRDPQQEAEEMNQLRESIESPYRSRRKSIAQSYGSGMPEGLIAESMNELSGDEANSVARGLTALKGQQLQRANANILSRANILAGLASQQQQNKQWSTNFDAANNRLNLTPKQGQQDQMGAYPGRERWNGPVRTGGYTNIRGGEGALEPLYYSGLNRGKNPAGSGGSGYTNIRGGSGALKPLYTT